MARAVALPVLVVDDDPALRSTLVQLLNEEGIPALAASCGKEAWQKLEEIEAGLILLDLGLPDVDGLELLSQLKAQEDIPVVVLTGRSDIATVVEAMKRGADNFLVKPTEAAQVLATVQKELSHHLVRRQMESQAARIKAPGMFVPVGQSRAMRHVLQLVERVAGTDASVVL